MTFYDNYSFFICLALSIVPAVILGIRQKNLAPYGCVISLLFIAGLFSKNTGQIVWFVVYLILEIGDVLVYSRLKASKSYRSFLYPLALIVAIAPLATYKISVATGSSIFGFIGISYITFKVIQMVLETHDGLIASSSLFDCVYFLLFFPTFTSGPIDRSRRFLADAKKIRPREEYLDLLGKGLCLIIVGACYSLVLAPICKLYWTPEAFVGWGQDTTLYSILASFKDAIAYSGYLFFDFAGYSFMAMGAGYCFGIEVPRNFKAPFASVDIKDFWNRWHITLSFWLRDFVFMRFSRLSLKHHLFKSRLTTACIGYLINMTLMGCWHGLTPDYICYGVYHGLLLALTDIYQKKSRFHKTHHKARWYRAISWAVTMVLVVFGFAIFSGQLKTFMGVSA